MSQPAAQMEPVKIPCMKYKWVFMGVSSVLTLISLFLIFKHGINYGVDFKGGVKSVYQFSKPVGDDELRKSLATEDLGDVELVQFGQAKDNQYLFKVKYQEGKNMADLVTTALHKVDPQVSRLSEETVGPKAGAELRKRGLMAVILTWILILVYIGFRFDFLFAPGAVIALIHDLTITLGFFTFFHKEFNLPILAAFLTILGYSINDTIIVYDRIREKFKKVPASWPISYVMDKSINETFSRTIVTSLTVLFAMVVLFILGGGVLHDFAFCMIVGVVTGTYSSIFVASPVSLGFYNLFPAKGMRVLKK